MVESSMPKRARGRPRNSFAEAGPATVQALDRGLSLLETLARNGDATLSDLALGLGMPPSTVHRILATLQAHDFVAMDESSQRWSIGVGAFQVGSVFLQRTNVVEAARAPMNALMDATGETANLGLPDGDEVVFVAQAESHAPIRAFFRPGTRSPLHASGIGKALLAARTTEEVTRMIGRTGLQPFTATTLSTAPALFADLEQTSARGFSLDDQERYAGMSCVAAVIYNNVGRAVAGVSVSGPSARFTPERLAMIGVQVRAAAQSVTQAIGGKPPARAP